MPIAANRWRLQQPDTLAIDAFIGYDHYAVAMMSNNHYRSQMSIGPHIIVYILLKSIRLTELDQLGAKQIRVQSMHAQKFAVQMQHRYVVAIALQVFAIFGSRDVDLFELEAMHERLKLGHQFIA